MIEYRVGILAIDVLRDEEKMGEIKRVKDGWQYWEDGDCNKATPTLTLISHVKDLIEKNLEN